MARPEKPIIWERVDELIIKQCKADEIAGNFDMGLSTFYAKVQEKWGVSFQNYQSSLSSKGKSILREKQWDKAIEGNVPLLQKLGDVYLDQDNKDNKLPPNDSPITELINTMKSKDAIKPETNTELQGSDTPL